MSIDWRDVLGFDNFPKPLGEKSWLRWIFGDQVPHMVMGAAIVSPLVIWALHLSLSWVPHWLPAVMGAVAGTVRELEQWYRAAKEERDEWHHVFVLPNPDGDIDTGFDKLSWPAVLLDKSHPADRGVDILFHAVGGGILGAFL